MLAREVGDLRERKRCLKIMEDEPDDGYMECCNEAIVSAKVSIYKRIEEGA